MPIKKRQDVTDTIDLDLLFRSGSKARKVAEALLGGGAYQRQELSDEYHVTVTTVNRVVEALEGAGAVVHRDTDGKRAVFEVVSIGPKPTERPYPSLGASARIIAASMLGSNVQIDFVADDQRYRGTVLNLLKGGAPVGLLTKVTSVNLEDDQTAKVTLSLDGTTIELGHCIAVTV